MKAEPARFKLTGQDARLIHSVTTRAVVKNWPWLSAYVIVTAGSIVGSYFTNKWWSVALSITVAVVMFFTGLRMLYEAVTITKEIR
jgi:hypothetical protein